MGFVPPKSFLLEALDLTTKYYWNRPPPLTLLAESAPHRRGGEVRRSLQERKRELIFPQLSNPTTLKKRLVYLQKPVQEYSWC